MRHLLDRLYYGTGLMAALCLFAIFVIMISMSTGRVIGFNIPAGDDFASWLMAATAFLGLAHTFKSGEMIRVLLVMERLQGKARIIAEMLALSIAVAAISFFTFHMSKMAYESFQFNDLAQGTIAFPLWIPQSLIAIGLLVFLVALIDEWLHVSQGNHLSFEKPPPKTAEELIERVAEGGGI